MVEEFHLFWMKSEWNSSTMIGDYVNGDASVHDSGKMWFFGA